MALLCGLQLAYPIRLGSILLLRQERACDRGERGVVCELGQQRQRPDAGEAAGDHAEVERRDREPGEGASRTAADAGSVERDGPAERKCEVDGNAAGVSRPATSRSGTA